MILPASTLASLLLLVLAFLCWGSWTNTQKLVYRWRFELYYYDFAVGVALCLLIAVFVFGSANPQELTVSDNMLIAGYRKIAWALAAGLVVNLANIMLVAAISLSGMTVAFPLAFGIGLIVMSISSYIGNPAGNNAALLFGGLVLLLAAMLVEIFAYRSFLDELASKSKTGPLLDPATKLPMKPPKAMLGVVLSLISGLAWGFFLPAIENSRSGENGVSPYGIAEMVGAAMFISTLIYVPFFVNFPVQGDSVPVRAYFRGTKKQHFWGIFGGVIWAVGLIAALVEAAAPGPARTSAALASWLVLGAPVLGALWGLFAWREFRGGSSNVKMLQFVMLALFAGGVLLLSLAPSYAGK